MSAAGRITLALYDRIGRGYNRYRRPDPRIAARMHAALGDARRVVNVGAGTGAYEPDDRAVVAVEPSAVMVAQRPPGAAPAVRASAIALPFARASFDAALAILTLHHWPDARAGLAELRRVARDRVVVFTWDPDLGDFWLVRDYFPDILARDRTIFPRLLDVATALGGAEVIPVPVPRGCIDGFLGAYWQRPEMYLDAGARGAISAFAQHPDPAPALARLRRDLADGSWAARNTELLERDELDVGYRLIVSSAGTTSRD